MKNNLKLYFETAIAVLSVIGIGVVVWLFFGGIYSLEHMPKVVYYNRGPQDPVDTH